MSKLELPAIEIVMHKRNLDDTYIEFDHAGRPGKIFDDAGRWMQLHYKVDTEPKLYWLERHDGVLLVEDGSDWIRYDRATKATEVYQRATGKVTNSGTVVIEYDTAKGRAEIVFAISTTRRQRLEDYKCASMYPPGSEDLTSAAPQFETHSDLIHQTS